MAEEGEKDSVERQYWKDCEMYDCGLVLYSLPVLFR